MATAHEGHRALPPSQFQLLNLLYTEKWISLKQRIFPHNQ